MVYYSRYLETRSMETWKVMMTLVAIITVASVIFWGLNIYSYYLYVKEISPNGVEVLKEVEGCWALLNWLPIQLKILMAVITVLFISLKKENLLYSFNNIRASRMPTSDESD